MRLRLFFGITMMMFSSVFAQRTSNALNQADKAYDQMQYDAAIRLYEKHYASDSGNTAVALRIADCYWNVRDYNKSFKWYNLVSADTIQANTALTLRMAELNAMKGNYDYAAEKLNNINGYQARAEGFRYKDEFLKDSADWNLGYLNINTKAFREFSPLIFQDKFIWSTNERVIKNRKGIMGWDANGFIRQVYTSDISLLESTDFPGTDSTDSIRIPPTKKMAKRFPGADITLPISKSTFVPLKRRDSLLQRFPELKGLEGVYYNVAHATASNQTGKMYLSVNRQEKLKSKATRGLGIVEADVEGENVTNTRFLPLVSNDPSVAEDIVLHAAIDPSGQFLVYSSNQLGGKGGYDLYVVKKIAEDQTWSSPIALTEINTPGNEVFSSFSPTGDLFFSSDGHPGLGGLDIYRVGFERGMLTTEPEHLSFPVNSSADDFGMIFTDNGRVGFFTTDRYGSDDIIAFDYKRKCTPLKGVVVEQGTNIKRSNVPVYLYQKDHKGMQMRVDSAVTNAEGVYTFSCARPNRSYTVYVHEPRVENVPPRMIAMDVTIPPSTNPMDLPLVAISAGKAKPPVFAKAPSTLVDSNFLKLGMRIDTSWVKKHDPHDHQKVVLDSVYFIIYFDFDKYALKQQSIATLNKATAYLKQNPNNGFILLGHTDLKGNATYNINLSKNRVFTAKKYMTARGIESKRLEVEYFGKQFPVKRAVTPEAGKLNRRVEFILIKK